MTVLAADRANSSYSPGDEAVYGVIAADIIYEGALVMTRPGHATTAGYVEPCANEELVQFVGVAKAKADNSAGAIGAVDCTVRKSGIFHFEYDGTPSKALIGRKAYAVDDQTVTTDATDNAEFLVEVGSIVDIAGTAAASDVYVLIDNAVDKFPQSFDYVIKNAEVITRGDLVCEDANGEAIKGADTANYLFLGMAIETVDNAADGLSIPVIPFGFVTELTHNSFADATIGDPCYVDGAQAVDLAACTANADAFVGCVTRKGAATTVYVYVNGTGEASTG